MLLCANSFVCDLLRLPTVIRICFEARLRPLTSSFENGSAPQNPDAENSAGFVSFCSRHSTPIYHYSAQVRDFCCADSLYQGS